MMERDGAAWRLERDGTGQDREGRNGMERDGKEWRRTGQDREGLDGVERDGTG